VSVKQISLENHRALASVDGLKSQTSHFTRARADIAEGVRLYWLWSRLAYHDIKMRYRGSLIGPFWLTLSTAIMAAMMGVLYSKLFNTDVRTYLPYVTIGLIVWQFISTTVNESCLTFVAVSAEVQQVRLPFSSHVFRLVYRNLLVLCHNVVILFVVLVIFPPTLILEQLTLIPAMAVLIANAAWLACLLGMLGARYRDLPPIISNFLQVLFFVTPIFWRPESLGRYLVMARYNPLHAAIDIIRSPLLGVAPDVASWPIMLAMTLVGCVVTFAVFARLRGRIAYWV